MEMRRYVIERESVLPGVSSSVLWDEVVTPEGINYELLPFLKMTVPPQLKGKRIDEVPLREPLGRAWVKLFGLVPVDFDDLVLDQVGPGSCFREVSSTSLCRLWMHEREVGPSSEGGAYLKDRVSIEMRAPAQFLRLGFVAERIVGLIFSHRHARLLRRYR